LMGFLFSDFSRAGGVDVQLSQHPESGGLAQLRQTGIIISASLGKRLDRSRPFMTRSNSRSRVPAPVQIPVCCS
jgi:hypothetical protein